MVNIEEILDYITGIEYPGGDKVIIRGFNNTSFYVNVHRLNNGQLWEEYKTEFEIRHKSQLRRLSKEHKLPKNYFKVLN